MDGMGVQIIANSDLDALEILMSAHDEVSAQLLKKSSEDSAAFEVCLVASAS